MPTGMMLALLLIAAVTFVLIALFSVLAFFLVMLPLALAGRGKSRLVVAWRSGEST